MISKRTPETKNPNEASLRSLQVLEKLEVGPVQVKRRQIQSPYTVTQKSGISAFNLTYHFEEDVLDPSDPISVNLASMIMAQVAINYGLFFEEIVFHDTLDAVDQRFIKDMMINTAREIYVVKFLGPNPFLIGDAAALPLEKKDTYLQARLLFPRKTSDFPSADKISRSQPWSTDKNRHAVLSSGGKDSLLSFGLLKEIGKNVHPIFINESGRHWYTALNGYRYSAANYPETSKVWTNADRLFAWMLRRFPFVRQDFAQIRSDDYPIRLWTVAVFLFGALPLLKKRGIGRLVIGDEYDSTNRTSYKGITHYNGLYDQSRYFDRAMTRYFFKKGWEVSQFSILRPLSELLIEKTLYERYPILQSNQVSCHAAHIEENRVYPCGKCEKCRRIVGMLKALDGDPTNCGYTKAQIQYCLRELLVKGVHQESAGAQHLFYLLEEKGLFEKGPKGSGSHPRPEITKIRFDPKKSPFATTPTDLRKPLFEIYLTHAAGAAKRIAGLWTDFNPLEDPALVSPFLPEDPQNLNNESSEETFTQEC
ncbi:MAG: hypothetical protein JXB23_12430 [Candidatus Aminicenantes bacterium]|nr:hypothetical protein [Candidatus Aminicenantes bacterium]